MDGGEVEIRRRGPAAPALTYGYPVALTEAEKMDLVALAAQPVYKTLCKLFDIAIVRARDEAMMTDSAEEKAQLARLIEARAMAVFAGDIRKQIETAIEEHRITIQTRVAQDDLKDRGRIEEIICNPMNLKPGFPEQ